jgi:hypothetical protein
MPRPYSLLSDDWFDLLSRRKKVRYDNHYVQYRGSVSIQGSRVAGGNGW